MAVSIGPFQNIVGVSWQTWYFEYTGFLNAGKPYIVSNGGNTVVLRFEDSITCGGANANRQVISGVKKFGFPDRQSLLSVSVDGLVEHEDPQFDTLVIRYVQFGSQIEFYAASQGFDKGCEMGPPAILLSNFPLILPAGGREINVVADTGDGEWHKDAYYRVEFTLSEV